MWCSITCARLAQSGFARNVRFVEDYDPSLPPVLGNRDQLIQVFLNLVKNAAEAIAGTSGGEISSPPPSARRAAVGAGQQVAVSLPLELLRQGQRLRACPTI